MKIFTVPLIALLFHSVAGIAAKPQDPKAALAAAPSGPPAETCLQSAGALGRSSLPKGIDGTALKNASDVKSLRSKAKDGRLLVIEGGDFSGQKFGSDNFSNICFVGTNLSRTRWSKSRAQGIGFINANLSGAAFDRVIMDYVLFRNTVLEKMDATGARFTQGQLDGGWEPSMAGLKLDQAQMNGFRFACGTSSADGCPFDRKLVSFQGTNFASASLHSYSFWDSNLNDVRLDNTEIAIDQIGQFSTADVAGPVYVRAGDRRVMLSADTFRVATGRLAAGKGPDDECTTADSPVKQFMCQAGQTGLRSQYRDIERLYRLSLGQRADQPSPVVTSGQITVTAANPAHARYQKALGRCMLREEEAASACLGATMAKRRSMLVTQLTQSQPLEAEARAVYVSAATPLVDTVVRDQRLAALTPLLVDLSPHVLLAFRDEDQRLVARGIGQSPGGVRCEAHFAPPARKKARKGMVGPAFIAWSSGAEFSIGAPVKARKSRKRQSADMQPPAETGCTTYFQSGPLVRLPASEDEFNRLWAAQKTRS